MSSANCYLSLSRFTDPKSLGFMLNELPDDPVEICEIAKLQTIHHNLLSYYGVPSCKWKTMRRIWPPRMPDILSALKEIEPHDLSSARQSIQRVLGACMLESHFLAAMLRYKRIPVRIRAGYFKGIRTKSEFVVRFWESVQREKNVMGDLLQHDPQKWRAETNAHTIRQNELDHHIEHWICEYWDQSQGKWRLLDANNTFLKAHGDIDVDFHLPRRYFEYSCEAWQKIRGSTSFNPDQYAEDRQDGRSHIRSQLLWDYFSLLNHDIAGYDETTEDTLDFVKKRKYEEISAQETQDLDALAKLLSQDPNVDELTKFYHKSATLTIESAEKDHYSFVLKD